MATTSSADFESVDASLWWDPFSPFLTELENVSPAANIPPSLVKKLEANRAWFLNTVSLFKPPNPKSRGALNSGHVRVGSNEFTVVPELKATALEISSVLCLDEVQSYILVKRSNEDQALASDHIIHTPLHLASVMLQYYNERQCLLKCTRQILMYSLYDETGDNEFQAVRDETQKLIVNGLEIKLLSVLQDLLTSSYPENMSIDFFNLWAEETLIEDNLVLDILFLAYYESLCTCNGKQWKKLCLLYEGMISGAFNFGKLALSTEAIHSIYNAKVQLLLILINTLDLEHLLRMIHDQVTFRQGITVFSLTDIQEIDSIISGCNVFEDKEAGVLILTWAVFLCLISSLPGREECNAILEIDHVGYVRQAFKAAPLSHFVEILQISALKDNDMNYTQLGPTVGYRSVLRTFMSSFIAAYEINVQLEDNNFKLILDILGKIYRGEESLCSQFWDKDSFIDGPIRCLLLSLEAEFPFRTVELVRLLSSLCEGTWPAECVYNFLDKSVGFTSLFEINRESVVDNESQVVEAQQPLSVPGIEGVHIPRKTRGRVLKLIDGTTALVRWELAQSGFPVLLLRLARTMYMDGFEEAFSILDLLSRLVTFNSAVYYALMHTEKLSYDGANPATLNLEKVDIVELICTLVKNISPTCNGALMMSMGVNILTKMLICSPAHVSTMALKTNIFDVALNTNPLGMGSDGLLSGSWLLSGRLAKMLLIDCEHNESSFPLAISVLDFTIQLVETGEENDIVLALIVFSLQYVLVNHDYWKYKVKHVRWEVLLKVLEVIKKCTLSTQYSKKLGKVVHDILHFDSSVHSSLFRILCTTTEGLEKLYVSRLYELMEIEGLELAISSVLDVLISMLSNLSKDTLSGFPVFYQAVLSSTTKPIPVYTAAMSLISYFRNSEIQTGATRLLSLLFFVADYSQPYVTGNTNFGLGDNQIINFRNGVDSILRERSLYNEDLVFSTFQMLTSATNYQPAFLVAVISCKENVLAQASDANVVKASKEANLVEAVLGYIVRSNDLIKSHPRILFSALNFMKALWQGAAQFSEVLERVKNSENFWIDLSASMLLVESKQDVLSKKINEPKALSSTYQCLCQSNVLEIMAHELFLQKKLLHAGKTSELLNDNTNTVSKGETEEEGLACLKDVLSTWWDNAVLGVLIKTYSSCVFDSRKYLHSKITAGLLAVHVMEKLRKGDTGSLSVFLIDKLNILFKKLNNLPAYSEVASQYSQRGYSEGKELNSLILTDLYYHLQGELEGRPIDHRPFKELAQCLLESNFLQMYQKYDRYTITAEEDMPFDSNRLQADLGLNMWEVLGWKASKEVAETLLLQLQDVNSMLLVVKSKQSALEALTTILSLYDEDKSPVESTIQMKIPEQLILSSAEHTCHCLHATFDSLIPVPDNNEDILVYLVAQARLLLHLIRLINKRLPPPLCLLIVKTSGSGLKVLTDFRQPVSGVRAAIKVLLELLLLSMKLSCANSQSVEVTERESVEPYGDASNANLGILPLLCKCMEPEEHCTLSLTTMDLILKSYLTPSTWFPILHKHLHLQHIFQYFHDEKSSISIPIILKFFLSLAHVRGGAEMLCNAGFFASLRVLLADVSEDSSVSLIQIQQEKSLSNSSNKVKKPRHIWGLGLAVVTAIIQSLGDSSSCRNLVDYVMEFLFLEKSYMIFYYLSMPDLPSDVHEKKRPRALKTKTTLSALKEMEHTIVLFCVLSKHRNSWIKATKEMDSLLREKCIHLLAFISQGTQQIGESPSKVAPIFCHPVLKEEVEWSKKPSFVKSRNGWFGPSSLGCGLDPVFSNVPSRTALAVKDRASENSNMAQTYFSDISAIQIYRIAFLLLKFLCLQAEGAAKRAEEVGFVDVAHFPELPVPDILHGLQDQGIAIVHELCEARKSKQVPSDIQNLCIVLLQITEMALHLEFCVLQICGIRPVLGRVEDFSKEVRVLIRATEGHVFLKEAVKSLKQIISFVYPGLLRSEGFL